MKVEIKKLENSQVEISVVIPNKEFESHREHVEEHLLAHVEVDGFRKGNVPKDIAIKKVGEMTILEEIAHHIISEKYPEILADKKIRAIGQPQITITKIGAGSDLEFKIVTAILPEIKIADYKKIAREEMKKELDLAVNEKEIDGAILQLRRMRAQQDSYKNLKDGEKSKSLNDFKDEDLPELNDEWVKTLGDFKNVSDFRERLEKNIAEEKKARAEEKRRLAIVDGIIEKSAVEVPEILVNYELEKMAQQMEHDLAMSGFKVEDYLTKLNKTKEDLRKEWLPTAEKHAKTQLLVNHIATLEKLDPNDEEINKEVEKILEQYKDSKEELDENHVRAYVATILTNQKVFEFLEGQK